MGTKTIRPTLPEDLPAVRSIIEEGRRLLRESGIDQWQDGHPSEEDLADDLAKGYGRVLELDGEVVATAALCREPDPNYRVLLEGTWASSRVAAPGEEGHYATIHRVAVAAGHRGQRLIDHLYSALIDEARSLGYHQVRVDTHPENLRMQHVIERHGFQRAGLVCLRGNRSAVRVVYQLFL